MSFIKLINSITYSVIWLNHLSKFSLKYMYIYMVNLNLRLYISKLNDKTVEPLKNCSTILL